MFIPLKDDNRSRSIPVVTVSLIVLNVLAFLYQASLWGDGGPAGVQAWRELTVEFGLLPCRVTGQCPQLAALPPPGLTVLTSMFLHGGLLHVAGNMLYLWIFGNNVEATLHHGRFLLFYVASGIVGAFGQTLASPASSVPMIGASGAIAGVLGAYLILFPHASVVALVAAGFYVRLVHVPALLVLGLWIVLQVVSGFLSAGLAGLRGDAAAGVAWFAHIGGFLAGIALLPILRPRPRRT